jgi:hypothetical protein
MGFGKFWIKHGPGSVGSIAKAVTKDFMKWKQEYPSASKAELLRKTLSKRANSYSLLGLKPLNQDKQEEMLKESNEKLTKLIELIFHNENPASLETVFSAPEVYRLMLQVILEVVDKHGPGIDGSGLFYRPF